MTTIQNPTAEQITAALAIVERGGNKSCSIIGDRYAMTNYGTFVNNGNVSIPKEQIQAIRYISTYGTTCGSMTYILVGISMYSKADIIRAELIPVMPNEFPQYFPCMETIIQKI